MIKCICFLLLLIHITTDDSLYYVFEHFRHGARSPWRNLSKNYTDILGQQWVGVGELTNIGVSQLYLLGIYTKNKYKDFISSSFDPKEILVYSTNVNRTIASAQAHMTGMFSQSDSSSSHSIAMKDLLTLPLDISNLELSNITYIPVPIHTYQEKKQWSNETYLFQTFTYDKSSNCPKVTSVRKSNIKSLMVVDYIRHFSINYSSFFKEEFFINDINYTIINDICDSFISGVFDKRDFSTFTSKGINMTEFLSNCYSLEYIKQFHIDQGGKASFTGVMTMSSTMLQIVSHMEHRISINDNKQADYSSPKFVIYSGHDSTIVSMEAFIHKAFNIDYQNTPFGSSLFIELHKRDKDVFWVEYYYNGVMEFNITFDVFKARVTQTAWSEARVNDFCYISTFKDRILLSLLLISIVLLVISISLLCYCSKNKFVRRGFVKVIETKEDELPNNSSPVN